MALEASSRNVAVFGIFTTLHEAERAVERLLQLGFSNSDISVLLPDDESTRSFAHERHTKAPEGTVTGASAVGALAGMGIPEYEAKRYEGRVTDGGILLSAHCDSDAEIEAAEDALAALGAQDISTADEVAA